MDQDRVCLPRGPRGPKVKRVCLRCDEEFASYGKRICPKCTAANHFLLQNNTWEALVYGIGGERGRDTETRRDGEAETVVGQ